MADNSEEREILLAEERNGLETPTSENHELELSKKVAGAISSQNTHGMRPSTSQ